MKRHSTLVILLFYANVATAQLIGLGIEFNSFSSASFLHSESGLSKALPDVVGLTYKLDFLWDSRKWANTMHGLRVEGRMGVKDTPFVTTGSLDFGAYYLNQTGLDYDDPSSWQVGMISYLGPHLRSTGDLITGRSMNLGFSNRIGIVFMTKNYMRLEVAYNLVVDLVGVFGTAGMNDHKFFSRGVSLGWSLPLSKLNGTTYFSRRKAWRRDRSRERQGRKKK